MIAQIGHLGKVSLRVGIVSAILYALGAALGAGMVGFALGSLGLGVRWLFHLGPDPAAPGVLLAVALAALLGGLRDLGLIPLRLPQPWRQVPRGWLQVFGPYKTGFFWGFAVGL